MFGLDPVASVLIVVIVGVAVGCWLFKKDTEKEERRRAANRVAGILRANGLELFPEFLEDYGVGDYSGMSAKIKKAAILFTDPAAAKAAFDKMYENIKKAKETAPAVSVTVTD